MITTYNQTVGSTFSTEAAAAQQADNAMNTAYEMAGYSVTIATDILAVEGDFANLGIMAETGTISGYDQSQASAASAASDQSEALSGYEQFASQLTTDAQRLETDCNTAATVPDVPVPT